MYCIKHFKKVGRASVFIKDVLSAKRHVDKVITKKVLAV